MHESLNFVHDAKNQHVEDLGDNDPFSTQIANTAAKIEALPKNTILAYTALLYVRHITVRIR